VNKNESFQQISSTTKELLKKEGSFNIVKRDTVSPKLPAGMVTYWLIGRKIEGEVSTVAGGEEKDTVTNGSTVTTRK